MTNEKWWIARDADGEHVEYPCPCCGAPTRFANQELMRLPHDVFAKARAMRVAHRNERDKSTGKEMLSLVALAIVVGGLTTAGLHQLWPGTWGEIPWSVIGGIAPYLVAAFAALWHATALSRRRGDRHRSEERALLGAYLTPRETGEAVFVGKPGAVALIPEGVMRASEMPK